MGRRRRGRARAAWARAIPARGSKLGLAVARGAAASGAGAERLGAGASAGAERLGAGSGAGAGAGAGAGMDARSGAGAGSRLGSSSAPKLARPTGAIKVRRAIRRAIKVSIGALAGALACGFVAVGGVDGAQLFAMPRMSISGTMAIVAIAALVLATVIRRVQFVPPSSRAQRVSMWLAAASDLADLELSLALVAGTHVVIAVTGGLSSPAYPLLYGVVAFAMSVLSRPGAIATIGAALVLEGALVARTGLTEATALAAGIHVAYLAGATAAHVVLLRGLVSRYRKRRSRRLDEEPRHHEGQRARLPPDRRRARPGIARAAPAR